MRVVFFGDSICFGEKVSPHKIWTTRIARELEDRIGDDCLVINSSVNGNTTRLALERMPSDVQKYEPDAMLIQFGMNDCNYWATDRGCPRVSPKAFQANLHEIADRSLAFGAHALILQTNHPTLRTTTFDYADRSYQESNEQYNELIREVAGSRSDIRLIDMETAWLSELEEGLSLSGLLLEDELHLDVQGHDLYFKTTLGPVCESLGL
jgi:acyl-CoA thioesterase I